jgi:NPCBM/NEW2 domain
MHRTTIVAGLVLATALSATALASADASPRHHQHATARGGTFKVTVSVDRTEPLLDSKVKIKGSVSPASPGAEVTLQVKYQDRKSWKTIAHQRLSGGSRFAFKDKVGSVRTRKYRVVKPAGPSRAAGSAITRKVTVFGWRDLTSISPALSGGFGKVDSLTMNGTTYDNSLRSFSSGNASIDYNLNRDCKSFRGTAGLDDISPSGGSAVVALRADGVLKYAGSFALTQSAPVSFDLTKVFRLNVAATLGAGGYAAVGTPQVLCSF